MTPVQLLLAIVAAMLVIASATYYRPRATGLGSGLGARTGDATSGAAHATGHAATRTSTRATMRTSTRSAPHAPTRIDLAALDVVSQQAGVIYADARAFSFNTGSGPAAVPEQLVRFDADGTGALAFSRTVTFFFAADSTNSRVPGAFALWREVNDGVPEALVRNVLPDTVPFFVYQSAVQAAPGGDSLAEVPSDRLPITFADTSGTGVDAQSLRAVEMHFLVTNGAHGASQKVERISILAVLPGTGGEVQPVGADQSAAPALILAGAPRPHQLGRATIAD
jgi:hypothetical protein